MQQLLLFQPQRLTVGELNRWVRQVLENDPSLQDIYVTGEVSGVSRPASGHCYFTLKDAAASVRCVMWRDAAARAMLPREGEAVEAHGHVSLYEAGGLYQLYVDLIRPAGQGELYAEFMRLKAKLEAEGLFDQQRKRSLPRWPRKIAVVTSRIGAAWQDVQNVLSRRFPLAELWLAPTAVQGEDAPAQICAALRAAGRAKPDVILLVRGGGSLEDLWAFNDERVVRAVATARVPVVTGVGHETDFTLVDFASDLRAPTPSAAAEVVSPSCVDLLQGIRTLQQRMGGMVETAVRERKTAIRSLELRFQASSPMGRLQNIRQQMDDFMRRAETAIRSRLSLNRTRLQGLIRVLEGVAPTAVLGRGYALVWRADSGRLVRSVAIASAGTPLRIQLADGNLKARSEGKMDSSAGKRASELPDG